MMMLMMSWPWVDALHIFWVLGSAIGKGIDLPDIGIRNGIEFHNFGIRNGTDSSFWYKNVRSGVLSRKIGRWSGKLFEKLILDQVYFFDKLV